VEVDALFALLNIGAKRMVGKKGSGASEWRTLLQVFALRKASNTKFSLNAIEIHNTVQDMPNNGLSVFKKVLKRLGK